MDETTKAFKEYTRAVFGIEKVALYLFCSLHVVCEELNTNPSKKELNKDDLDARLSEVMGRKIDSSRLGIRDVDGAVVPHGKIRRRLFRKVLVNDGFVFSYDILSEQLGKRISSLLTREERKLREKGVEIPPHVKSFLRYLGRENDEALQDEFLSRIDLCANMNEASRMCDEMKRKISLDELKLQLDDLSVIEAASDARVANIELGVGWLVFDSLFN